MWIDHAVPVKYTKCKTATKNYDTGLVDYDNIESFYKGQCIRDKVICRLDATYYFRKYFTEETINKYRPALMMLATGQVLDPETLSNVINEFIDIDKEFAKAIVRLFHSCPEDCIFGIYIIQCLADVLINAEQDYRNFFRGKPQVVICLSDGYIYFSVSDVDMKHYLPCNLECEVISYGKNWKGDFICIE